MRTSTICPSPSNWLVRTKSLCGLLALLHLGVKGIRLGPTLPAFVSPTVAKVLVENFTLNLPAKFGRTWTPWCPRPDFHPTILGCCRVRSVYDRLPSARLRRRRVEGLLATIPHGNTQTVPYPCRLFTVCRVKRTRSQGHGRIAETDRRHRCGCVYSRRDASGQLLSGLQKIRHFVGNYGGSWWHRTRNSSLSTARSL